MASWDPTESCAKDPSSAAMHGGDPVLVRSKGFNAEPHPDAAPSGPLPLPLPPAPAAPPAARLLHGRGGEQAVDGVQPRGPQGVVQGLVTHQEQQRDLRVAGGFSGAQSSTGFQGAADWRELWLTGSCTRQ